MNHDDHMHGMPGSGMGMGMGPPSPATMTHTHHHMMMHMTFFWSKNAEILFSGWPGDNNNLGMYVLALFVVFLLAFIVEWVSHWKFIKEGTNDVVAGMVQTILYCIRIGLAYMVMLAVMSFNGGVFIVAVAGHTLGFLFFGSRVFKKSMKPIGKTSDLPPITCC